MSDKIELNRRRVLGGIATVGAASAALGAGTFAYFSDTEESTGNSISAGTLNLTAGGNDGTATTTVEIGDVAPGDSGSGSSTLANTGSIDGSVDLVFGAASNGEGDNPESEGDTSGDGDLGSLLEITVSVGSTQIRSGTFNSVFDDSEEDENVPLAAEDSKDLTLEWSLPTAAGNDAQGDSVSGDITIELNQTDGQ